MVVYIEMVKRRLKLLTLLVGEGAIDRAPLTETESRNHGAPTACELDEL